MSAYQVWVKRPDDLVPEPGPTGFLRDAMNQALTFTTQSDCEYIIICPTNLAPPTRKATNMSNVKWCDPGNHAFKAGTPGSQQFAGSTVNDEGVTVQIAMDACADHSFQSPTPPQTKALDPS